MRLNPGMSLDHAEQVLRRAENTWNNAWSADNDWAGYNTAVHDTYAQLKQVFASPDLGSGLLSPAYWHLLALGQPRALPNSSVGPFVREEERHTRRAQVDAVRAEIQKQREAMADALVELEKLKELAQRPGLPVVYDTNMLLHWQQPGDTLWVAILNEQGEDELRARLVVPLKVLDELDRQKYGQGDLAKKAATVIKYLDRVFKDVEPGSPVELRRNVTLEVWLDTDERGEDADLAILRCAADLDGLHPSTGARVLTGDIGMRLRAGQMGLKTLRLPESARKKGTALDEVPVSDGASGS